MTPKEKKEIMLKHIHGEKPEERKILDMSDANRKFYSIRLIELLGMDDDVKEDAPTKEGIRLKQIMAQIKTYEEFESVEGCLSFAHDWLPALRSKDPKNEHRNKKRFEKAKAEMMEYLAGDSLRYVEKLTYERDCKTHYTKTREESIKDIKKMLSKVLLAECNTGKNRAKEIVNILDFLKTP